MKKTANAAKALVIAMLFAGCESVEEEKSSWATATADFQESYLSANCSRYVDSSATPGGDGLTAQNAFQTVEQAVKDLALQTQSAGRGCRIVPVGSGVTDVSNFIENDLEKEFELFCSSDQKKSNGIIQQIEKDYLDAQQAMADYEELIARREFHREFGLNYSDCRSSLEDNKMKILFEDGQIFVWAVGFFATPTNSLDETGERIVTEGNSSRIYNLQTQSGRFRIVEKIKAPLLPESEDDDAPMLLDDGSQADDSSQPDDDYPLEQSRGTYNGANAATWAMNNYLNPIDTELGYSDYTDLGGDCTNFVSHAMKKGGWYRVNKWFWRNAGAGVCNNMTNCKRSASWCGAPQLYLWLKDTSTVAGSTGGAPRVTKKFTNLVVPSAAASSAVKKAFKDATIALGLGDIVQASSSDTTNPFHTTIVTKKDATNHYLYVTYRNATGFDPKKNVWVGEFKTGRRLHGFAVKASFIY